MARWPQKRALRLRDGESDRMTNLARYDFVVAYQARQNRQTCASADVQPEVRKAFEFRS